MVSEREPVLPTVTFPKLRLVGLPVKAPGATPVADTGTVNVAFVAVEVMVRFPLSAPPDVGANETVNAALCPLFNVSGVAIPVTLRPAPVMPTAETVTLAPPVFVIVSDSVPLLPTFTLPKLRLVGLALNAPGATPVPDTAIVMDGFGASDAMVTVPLAFPLDFGANAIVNVVLLDAARVIGVDIPVMENADPVTDT
jgi:hypothetical protein